MELSATGVLFGGSADVAQLRSKKKNPDPAAGTKLDSIETSQKRQAAVEYA